MADPIRLHAEFQDDLGTDYKLNIHQAGFVGSSTEFNLGADGFTLRYSGNNEDRMQPIIGSEVTFTLVENVQAHTTFLEALATGEDADYTISIYKDPDGANTLFWTGVLLHEQVELQDEAYPIQNTMTAVDDLGNLKNILYDDDGTLYTGRDTIAEHLVKLLNKTRALHVFDSTDVFLRYANDFKPTTFASVNALIELEVGHAAFYNNDISGATRGMDCFEVLKNFAITFNARVFLHEGCFYFVPVGAVVNSTTVNLYTVTKAGTVSASATATDTQLTVDTDMVRMRGGVTTFLPPLNKVQRIWRTDANLPVLGPKTQFLNATAQQTEMGTVINDNGLGYDSGTVFRLRYNYEHTYDGNGTSTGSDVYSRLVMRTRIKVGSLYYTNAVNFGPETMNVGNFANGYSVDVMTFTTPTWSSTAGYFYWAVTPTPIYLDRNTGQFYVTTGAAISVLEIENFIIELDGLTSNQTGIEASVDIGGFDSDGTLITDVTGTDAYGKLQFQIEVVNGNATNGDQVIYNALTTSTNQETLQQDEVVIGSSGIYDYRNIYENNSSPDQIVDSFASFANPSATSSIHQLGVKEIISGQNASTRVKRGSFYKAFVSPFHALLFDTRNFLPFETTFLARAVEAEYEAFHITTNDTNVSTPDVEVIDDYTPIDDSEPVYDLRNAIAAENGNLPPNIFQRFLQQPVTEVRNIDGGTYDVSSTDILIFNSWSGPNGSSIINLPSTTGNEGRIIRFKSDSTISANTKIILQPNSASETIDGASNYDFNRSYDGLSLLCHDSQWFIIQRKEK
jgi:hypothetical protein